MRQATPATAREIAMFGHVAAAIREAMTAKGMNHADLNQAIGRERGHTGVYHWINGKGAPGPGIRPKLAKVLGVPAASLERRAVGERVSVAAEPGTALVRLPSPGTGAVARVPEVLQFAVLADGSARLRLDLTVPAERGVALLRLLLDAGMIVQGD
jgi:transcriptional regulator with XRE-family HTH domain